MAKHFCINQYLKTLLFSGCLVGCAAFDFDAARSTINIYENVPYRSDSQSSRHQADLFVPKDQTGFPVVVFVHGGYWNSQDKAYFRLFTGLYSNVGIALAKRGIGTVVTDYRISPEVQIEGELQDVGESLKWAIAHLKEYGGNPNKMVLAGHSAGGHMTALLGLEPDRLRAIGVDTAKIKGYMPLSPILDLEHMEKNQDAAFNNSATYPVFGRSAELWKKYSPKTYFKKAMPPFFIAYGSQDYPYLQEQNQHALEQLKALGSPTESFVVPEYTHEDMVMKMGKEGDKLADAMADFVFRVTK